MVSRHSSKLSSLPVQSRLSRKMGPEPGPKAARGTAMASVRGREGGIEGGREGVFKMLHHLKSLA